MMNISRIINTVCIFITACLVGYVIYISTQKPNTIDNSLKNQVVTEAKIISKKIDKNGLEHTIVEETNNVLPKNLINSVNDTDKAFIDSLLVQTDIQKKEIVSLTKINQTIQGKNLQAVAVIDSLNQRKFEYSDKNFYVSYTPTPDSAKAGKFNYKYNQDLKVIQYNRKKWLLGEDHKYMDISTDDLNSTINGVQKLSVLSEPKDFGVKLTAKSAFFPQSGHMAVGGQLRIRYKRVTATGSNLYFPNTQKWIPVVGMEYDILNY